jgi:Domain of unknown function (DUF4349)
MSTKTHSIAPEEIMAHVDGELSGVYSDLVGGHIAECEECQKTAGEFQRDKKVMLNWRVESLPERVIGNILSHPLLENAGKTSRRFLPHIPVWTKWAAGTALAAMVILVLGQRSELGLSKVEPKVQLQGAAAYSLARNESREQLLQRYKQALEMKERAALSASLERDDQDKASIFVSESGKNIIPPAAEPGVAPMIARTVSLNIVVKDFAAARGSLDAILARHHGYAGELTVNTTENSPRTLNASLRVPAPELAVALNELKALGRVENESQSGEEVSQQHADLMARLNNSRETEQRMQAILQQRTGKISDVLEVEQEIARVRGEIEQMEAELKSMEHRVDFATVNLNLSDVYQAQLTTPYSVGTRLRNGFVTGYHNAAETLLGVALFFIEAGPSLLIWVVLVGLPVLFVWRRYRRSLASL